MKYQNIQEGWNRDILDQWKNKNSPTNRRDKKSLQ